MPQCNTQAFAAAVQRDDKSFTIKVNGQQKVISLDWLKLAHVHVEDTSVVDTTPIDNLSWLDSPPITSPTLYTRGKDHYVMAGLFATLPNRSLLHWGGALW